MKLQNATIGSLTVSGQVCKCIVTALACNVVERASTLTEGCHKARSLKIRVSPANMPCKKTRHVTYSARWNIIDTRNHCSRGIRGGYDGLYSRRIDSRIDGREPSYRLTDLQSKAINGYSALALGNHRQLKMGSCILC